MLLKISIPKPSKSKNSGVFGFVIQFFVIGIIFFAIGFAVGQKKLEIERKGVIPNIVLSNQAPPANQVVDFSLFWQVLEAIPQKYLEKSAIDGQKILYGAISGMTKSLDDPYTDFFNPNCSKLYEK